VTSGTGLVQHCRQYWRFLKLRLEGVVLVEPGTRVQVRAAIKSEARVALLQQCLGSSCWSVERLNSSVDAISGLASSGTK